MESLMGVRREEECRGCLERAWNLQSQIRSFRFLPFLDRSWVGIPGEGILMGILLGVVEAAEADWQEFQG
jgi:hypothetical protein